MELWVVVAVAAAAAILAAVLVGLILASRASARRATTESELRGAHARIEEITAEREQARERVQALTAEAAQLRTERAADAERLAWLKSAESSLRETFESLASRALQANARSLSEASRTQLDQFAQVLKADWGSQKQELSGLVKPLGDELKKLDHQVRTLEEKREGAYQTVNEQIRQISEQYRQLQTATTSLDSALRNPGVRGKWGEVQLRRLVELSGMTEHVDFDEQATGNASADGGRGRPDLIVHLPSKAILPVDAKAPMSAYLESVEAPTPELQAVALKRHAKALRDHIGALSQKAYWTQFDRSPEFVVLLVPYESGLSAAFATDPGLLEHALANRVVVAAPASFLALLRVVAYGWMQLQLSENAEKISRAGKELLDRLAPFAGHLNKVANSLNGAVESLNDAAGSFERRILPSARRLQELGTSSEEPPEISTVDTRARHIADGGELPFGS